MNKRIYATAAMTKDGVSVRLYNSETRTLNQQIILPIRECEICGDTILECTPLGICDTCKANLLKLKDEYAVDRFDTVSDLPPIIVNPQKAVVDNGQHIARADRVLTNGKPRSIVDKYYPRYKYDIDKIKDLFQQNSRRTTANITMKVVLFLLDCIVDKYIVDDMCAITGYKYSTVYTYLCVMSSCGIIIRDGMGGATLTDGILLGKNNDIEEDIE